MRVGPFDINWPRGDRSDPYWDRFVSRAPTDPNNLVAGGIRRLPEGTVYAVKSDVHSPEIMSRHVKELAEYLGANRCGIVSPEPRGNPEGYPFAVVCILRTDYDPRECAGIGGQAVVLKGAYVAFNLGAWIRECGYRATRAAGINGERLAERAGLGTLDGNGRLTVPGSQSLLYVADVILTDLPLAPDAEVSR